jgi:nitroreductase
MRGTAVARHAPLLARTTTRERSAPPAPVLRLPRPRFGRGKSLPESLRRRRTIREIRDTPLPRQVLSNLLWAACGVNRGDGPFGTTGITAASASNSQEIDVYVALERGVYRFDARRHRLLPVVDDDLRPLAIGRGQRNVAMTAPVQLIFVVDVHRLTHTTGFQEPGLHDADVQKSYYYVDTGLIAGNVYLFAASQGLASWFHNCDRTGLAARLHLRGAQRVLFAQSIGYPVRR